MSIKKMVAAKQKCYEVINSCETIEHVRSAKQYIRNYYDLYEDGFGFNQLNIDLHEIKSGIEDALNS